MAGEERKTNFRILFRVAASLLVILTSFIVFQNIKEHRAILTETIIYNTIESPFGSRARIYLPDSTYVVLNAGSTLKYPVDFLKMDSRQVLLSGEGFFDVKKNKDSEFVVNVGDIKITALGTSFNVKAYQEEALIEATLVEGLLSINRGDSNKGAVILRPNERISIVKGENQINKESASPATTQRKNPAQQSSIPVREVKVEKSIDPVTDISWKDREWVIRGKTMMELSVLLERRYNVMIEMGDGVVGSFRFSGTLRDETLEQVLYAIRATSPIDYKIDGNKIILTQNNILRRQYEKMLKDNN